MNLKKVVWRLVLCTLFVIGLAYGFSAHATEAEVHETVLHETHEAAEAIEHEEGKAAQEALEMEAEAYSEPEKEMHETEKAAESHE